MRKEYPFLRLTDDEAAQLGRFILEEQSDHYRYELHRHHQIEFHLKVWDRIRKAEGFHEYLQDLERDWVDLEQRLRVVYGDAIDC